MKPRIMYIENKSELNNWGRIGRVSFSKTGRTMYYRGRAFFKVGGYKYNCIDVETGEEYWITGPKKRGGDRLYGGDGAAIDEDVREEYWLTIRNQPRRINNTTT